MFFFKGLWLFWLLTNLTVLFESIFFSFSFIWLISFLFLVKLNFWVSFSSCFFVSLLSYILSSSELNKRFFFLVDNSSWSSLLILFILFFFVLEFFLDVNYHYLDINFYLSIQILFFLDHQKKYLINICLHKNYKLFHFLKR